MELEHKIILLSLFFLLVLGGIFTMRLLQWVIRFIQINPESVQKITVHFGNKGIRGVYATNKFVIRNPENIKISLHYLDKIDQISIWPRHNRLIAIQYEFTYYFKDGRIMNCKRRDLNDDSDVTMQNILNLDEVLKQIKPIFTTPINEIAQIRLYSWDLCDDIEPYMVTKEEKELIDKVIQIERKELLANPEEAQTQSACGIEVRNKEGEMLYYINLFRGMKYYKELCSVFEEVSYIVEEGND